MDLIALSLFGVVFVFAFSLVGLAYLWWRESRFAQKQTVKRRLLYLSAGGQHGKERIELYRDKATREAGLLGRAAFLVPRLAGLDRLLVRSRIRLSVTAFLALTAGLGICGLLVGLRLLPNSAGAVLLALGLAAVPYLWLKRAERESLRKFEEQFPQALDLISRAMKAGHALSSALEVVTQEMRDPIGSEFGAAVDEIKAGLSVEDALENLYGRVPLQDVRFFQIAVVLHKETGGNITEVFEKMSRLVRERLQFRRQLRALTAEGRLSALVLLLLPVFMFGYLYVRNFDYISLLWTDRMGRIMGVGALVMQAIGFLVMRRMVNFDA